MTQSRYKGKERNLQYFYRLAYSDYLAWLESGCGICGRDLHHRTPDVDHDHACDHPGKGSSCCRACVRGLLCRSCNLRVGAYERGLNSDEDIRVYLGQSRAAAQAYTQESLFAQCAPTADADLEHAATERLAS